jgi:hypothetical protein
MSNGDNYNVVPAHSIDDRIRKMSRQDVFTRVEFTEWIPKWSFRACHDRVIYHFGECCGRKRATVAVPPLRFS